MWKFKEMRRDDIHADPVISEFFTTEALGSLTDAVIRECIQNSLDARLDNRKVKVRISFPGAGQLVPPTRSRRYLQDLPPHLTAEGSGVRTQVPLDTPMRYLVFEDFGTKGLTGDPSQYQDAEGPKNDFYYFWRNIGRSRKSDRDRGRWGLGKFVVPKSSRIHSFFGLTVREDDPERTLLLMGQCILKEHKVGTETFCPYGYFGEFDGDAFAMPITDEALIRQFSEDFRLVRQDEPGLSLVVPFPFHEQAVDIDAKNILTAIVKHYFFPILDAELIVEVSEGSRSWSLDDTSIFSLVESDDVDLDSEERRQLLEAIKLAKWAISLEPTDVTDLSEQPTGRSLQWNDSLIDPEALAALRQDFKDARRVAVRVPMWVQPEGKESEEAFFMVYLERDEELEKGESHFVRQGITITEVYSGIQNGVRGIVCVRDDVLSSFLGDAENPAHTNWSRQSSNFQSKYVLGPSSLTFVKNSLQKLVGMLSGPREGRDESLLRDVFYVESPPEPDSPATRGKPGSDRGTGTEDTPDGDRSPDPRPYELSRIDGGFRIGAPDAPENIPPTVVVEAAFQIRKGNAFKRYIPVDFEFDKSPISVESSGVQITRMEQNILEFDVLETDFEVSVTGFDTRRDLRIRATPVKEVDQRYAHSTTQGA